MFRIILFIPFLLAFNSCNSLDFTSNQGSHSSGTESVQFKDPIGQYDVSFGTNGIYSDSSTYVASLIGHQSDGKVIVIGNDGTNWKIKRLDKEGNLDNSFGTAGVTTYAGTQTANTLIIQDDDKIIVLSRAQIIRLNKNGSLDTSFATAGVHTFGFVVNKMQLDSAGNILCSGNSGQKLRVEKLNSAGTSLGVFSPAEAINIQAYGSTIDKDNNLFVVGIRNLNGTGHWSGPYIGFMAKVKSDGTLDTTFGPGSQGWLTYSKAGELASNYADTKSAVVLDDGSIIGSGVFDDDPRDMFLVKITSAGALDTTFGADTDGFAVGGYSGTATNKHFQGWDLSLLPNGKILAVGNSGDNGKIAKYFDDGTLDTSFGTAGIFSIDHDGGGTDIVQKISVLPSGSILACGYSDGGFYVAKIE